MSELVKGSVLFFNLYDVCEEIQLETVRDLLGAIPQPRTFKHAAPEYVRFERAPVIEPIKVPNLSPHGATGQVKYYEYGVISVLFEMPFHEEIDRIVELAAKWMSSTEFEAAALQIVRDKVKKTEPALVRPYANWINEDYFIFQFHEVAGVQTAGDLISKYGDRIAQIVSGETLALSREEQTEILQSSASYHPSDVAIIGWNASVIYDSPTGAQTAIQLLEYANSQLLEFRYYDEFLSGELSGVYRFLKASRGVLSRWTLPKQVARLQSITVEVTELVERVDNSIKFLSDLFSARLYRLAAAKVGVPDYKSLVNQKLHTAEDLYRALTDQFQASRGFVLEVMVVIILVIELVFLFRGK
jgi:molybdopterin biosynthesis enzyme MoaB